MHNVLVVGKANDNTGPQLFAKSAVYAARYALRSEDVATLQAGPSHPAYDEAWDSVLESCTRTDAEGRVWRLHVSSRNDIYEMPEGE